MRHNAVGFLVEEVLDGEVGELQTERTHQTGSTPAERELNLVAGFGLQVVGDIYSSVFGIGLDIGHEFLLVKVSHLCQFAQGAHDVRLRVELTGLGVEFATHDVLIDAGVTDDVDLVDGSRFALVDTHLEVDGVIIDIDLYGVHIEE